MGSVVGLDGLLEEVVALLRTVAVEAFLGAHLIDRLVHGLDDSRCKRQGDIADAQADHLLIRICLLEFTLFACNGGEQVAVLQVLIILVNVHSLLLLFMAAAINALNSGCARFGRDLNSGWN